MAQKSRNPTQLSQIIDLPAKYLDKMPATALRGLPLRGTVCDLLNEMWRRELERVMRGYDHHRHQLRRNGR